MSETSKTWYMWCSAFAGALEKYYPTGPITLDDALARANSHTIVTCQAYLQDFEEEKVEPDIKVGDKVYYLNPDSIAEVKVLFIFPPPEYLQNSIWQSPEWMVVVDRETGAYARRYITVPMRKLRKLPIEKTYEILVEINGESSQDAMQKYLQTPGKAKIISSRAVPKDLL